MDRVRTNNIRHLEGNAHEFTNPCVCRLQVPFKLHTDAFTTGRGGCSLLESRLIRAFAMRFLATAGADAFGSTGRHQMSKSLFWHMYTAINEDQFVCAFWFVILFNFRNLIYYIHVIALNLADRWPFHFINVSRDSRVTVASKRKAFIVTER